MDKKEYLAKKDNLQKQMAEIGKQMAVLKNEYLMSNQPYPIGTKLEVKHTAPNGKTKVDVGYLRGYYISNCEHNVYMVLAAINKDGTPSKRNKIHIHYWMNPIFTEVK